MKGLLLIFPLLTVLVSGHHICVNSNGDISSHDVPVCTFPCHTKSCLKMKLKWSETFNPPMCICAQGIEDDKHHCRDPADCQSGDEYCDVTLVCSFWHWKKSYYLCTCQPGFQSKDGTCVVIDDKCIAGTHSCDPNAVCTNYNSNTGSYDCTCKEGFEGDGFTCTEPNSCGNDYPIHFCGLNTYCYETNPGEYACGCLEGYKMTTVDYRCEEA